VNDPASRRPSQPNYGPPANGSENSASELAINRQASTFLVEDKPHQEAHPVIDRLADAGVPVDHCQLAGPVALGADHSLFRGPDRRAGDRVQVA